MRQIHTHLANASGVFHASKNAQYYNVNIYQPAEHLKTIIDCYWFADWNIKHAATHIQRNLPSPNMHLVFDRLSTYYTGVMTQAYETPLAGSHAIVGVKFKIGALNKYLPCDHNALKNLHFNSNGVLLPINTRSNLVPHDHGACIYILNQRFHDIPPASLQVKKVNHAWQTLLNNPDIDTVQNWANLAQVSVRTLQRLCLEYIGLTPKWLLRKQRCVYALKLLDNSDNDIYDVILHLKLSDQAHLIREFKTVLGLTPKQYQKL
ncbi:hypothetical protein PCIT_b0829 [Pseudoalteromonas citrea]|uniref:HTH araC/xylS-type domain-containing protein n=2 Tax=Pseudoalteromonas citrea TaxID=43655 RepID=A0AAD4AF30_9GAMM|nr:AraC family transcriptional regulator [Pseudoalteromonas citrea]KAF7764765.1 hypothetical protein PCIT_b0829 [Pseudoalteromonas citrea]